MGSFSIFHWIIVLLIVVLIFGTKRLPNIGKDLGDAMRAFKKGLQDNPDEQPKIDKPAEPAAPDKSAVDKPDADKPGSDR